MLAVKCGEIYVFQGQSVFVGLISDTHDDMTAIKKAVDIFNDRKVSHVLHAGDITSPFTFEVFDYLNCGFTGIFGNNDGDKLLLKRKAKDNLHNQPHLMILHKRTIVIVHEPDIVDALADSGHYDLVIYGHTHRHDVRRRGSTLIVNPGRVARLHKGHPTLAILDMEKMEAEIIKLLFEA